tara:strand:+ start:443 stop:610 length:168 start_codon:yes stop_codon:yes gene_type:complete
MITIKRHPNLNNWLEIRFFSQLIDQVTGRAQAVRIAERVARQNKGAKIYDLTLDN